MIDYSAIAASAGVVYTEADRYTLGHTARVLVDGGGYFFHPCTCPNQVDHDALVPNLNPGLPAQYEPMITDENGPTE